MHIIIHTSQIQNRLLSVHDHLYYCCFIHYHCMSCTEAFSKKSHHIFEFWICLFSFSVTLKNQDVFCMQTKQLENVSINLYNQGCVFCLFSAMASQWWLIIFTAHFFSVFLFSSLFWVDKNLACQQHTLQYLEEYQLFCSDSGEALLSLKFISMLF